MNIEKINPSEGLFIKNEDPSCQVALQCARAALDKNAENITVLDLRELSAFTDYFVICSAMSDRQVKAITDSISQFMKAQGEPALSVEGYSEGRWVLMDFGHVIIHIFLDALRDYYSLESLWSNAPRVSTAHLNLN